MSQRFRLKKFLTISSLYVLNCSKYFLIYVLGHFVPKNQSRKILNYIKPMYNFLCHNVPMLLYFMLLIHQKHY